MAVAARTTIEYFGTLMASTYEKSGSGSSLQTSRLHDHPKTVSESLHGLELPRSSYHLQIVCMSFLTCQTKHPFDNSEKWRVRLARA